MASAVQMPALSPTMKEGKITRWLKKEGDAVSAGDAIAEVETDKSNLEIESYEDGVLLQITVKEGESAPVGCPIAFVGAKGDKIEASPSAPKPQAQAAPPSSEAKPGPNELKPAVKAEPASPPAAVVPLRGTEPGRLTEGRSSGGPVVPGPASQMAEPEHDRLRASPLAKRMAKDQGVDLVAVAGSGPQGRIIKRDIEAALSHGSKQGAARALSAVPTQATLQPLSAMRRVIARRMAETKPGVPHFYLTVDIEMDAAMAIRDEAQALDTKVSVNDIIVKATAIALQRFPQLNVQFQGDQILQLPTIDVGVAVALEDGLITPAVRNADRKGLEAISREVRDLAERARKRALKPEEYSGGSITVSNLGMFGIDEFIAVINQPQASILAAGVVAPRAVVREGEVVVRQMMSITLSGDHRAIDGAIGARYLQQLRGLLEHPLRLLF